MTGDGVNVDVTCRSIVYRDVLIGNGTYISVGAIYTYISQDLRNKIRAGKDGK
jgi:hypothetical protein